MAAHSSGCFCQNVASCDVTRPQMSCGSAPSQKPTLTPPRLNCGPSRYNVRSRLSKTSSNGAVTSDVVTPLLRAAAHATSRAPTVHSGRIRPARRAGTNGGSMASRQLASGSAAGSAHSTASGRSGEAGGGPACSEQAKTPTTDVMRCCRANA